MTAETPANSSLLNNRRYDNDSRNSNSRDAGNSRSASNINITSRDTSNSKNCKKSKDGSMQKWTPRDKGALGTLNNVHASNPKVLATARVSTKQSASNM